MESSKAKNPRERERERERERVERRRRRRRWDKKAYHRWRRHADHNKLQGWWCKKQEEEKRNMFGKPFQQQPYLMFCCISLLSQSFLSLFHICMSMCQLNPSLSVSWRDAKNKKHIGSIVPHKISQFFYCKIHLAHCIFLQNQAGYLTGPSFLPSLEPRRISNAQISGSYFHEKT